MASRGISSGRVIAVAVLSDSKRLVLVELDDLVEMPSEGEICVFPRAARPGDGVNAADLLAATGQERRVIKRSRSPSPSPSPRVVKRSR